MYLNFVLCFKNVRWRWRCRRGRGRPPAEIFIGKLPEAWIFEPESGVMDWIELSLPELEAIRLVDYEGLSYEDAAKLMNVSRATVWRLVKSARRKLVEAILYGKGLRILKDWIEKA